MFHRHSLIFKEQFQHGIHPQSYCVKYYQFKLNFGIRGVVNCVIHWMYVLFARQEMKFPPQAEKMARQHI